MGKIAFESHSPSADAVRTALDGCHQGAFWLDDLPPQPPHPSASGALKTDLLIVGGGFLVLWCALIAKERHPDRTVCLIEAERLGWAASGRNGGFCEASLTHGEKNGRQRWPDEYETLERLGQDNLQALEDTLRRYAIDCDYEANGLLTVAVEPYQDALLRRAPDYLDQASVRQELNSPLFLSGQWDKTSTATLHPAKLVRGLARAAAGLGVTLYENTQAVALHGANDTVLVKTRRGQITAQNVILATNAFPSLLWRYRLHTIPIYDYVLVSEPLSDQQRQALGWTHRQAVADMGNQFHYYRLTRDNRVLFGGYDAIYHYGGKIKADQENRDASHQRLAAHFLALFPQLAGIRFTHKWAGVIDTSTRFCAFYGSAHEGRTAYAAGFTGLGIAATRFAADVLLDKLDSQDNERTRLRMVNETPLPFPPEPLTYAAVQTMRWCLDQADHNQGRRNPVLRTLDRLGLGFDS